LNIEPNGLAVLVSDCSAAFLTSCGFGVSGVGFEVFSCGGLANDAKGFNLGVSSSCSICGRSLASSAEAVGAWTASADEEPVVEGNGNKPLARPFVVDACGLRGELSGDMLMTSSVCCGCPKFGCAAGAPNMLPKAGVAGALGVGALNKDDAPNGLLC
jgi:hypothetical protein